MARKPHAVMVPCPTPGHINPMLNLAKLLHCRGFFITFVITEYNHHRILSSGGQDSLAGLVDFQFKTISDGLPLSGREGMQYIKNLGSSLRENFPRLFRVLLSDLNRSSGVPPVTCVVAALMSPALKVAEELGILKLLFWTTSACGFMGTLQFTQLMERGYIPLPDESCLTNGYLDTLVEWIPGMKAIRLRDISCFIRTTDRNNVFLNFEKEEAECAHVAWGVILNTFDELEEEVVRAMTHMFPRVYTLGSLPALAGEITRGPSKSIQLSLWREDAGCFEWLDEQEVSSVVYVNFGSITVLTSQQLVEFAWGLADSKHPFLWIIRPDLVAGETAILPEKFMEETKGRSFLTSWCPQEKVLAHPSIGGFLTHGGWNSMLESIRMGVPMLCWPFFADQPANCRYACKEWGIAMEIEGDVKRVQVEALVRELMEGEKGKEMRKNAIKWKNKAEKATRAKGSSNLNLERLIYEISQEIV